LQVARLQQSQGPARQFSCAVSPAHNQPGEEVGPGKLVVVAYVVPRTGSAIGPDEVLAYGRRRLASYKAPKVVYLVDELARTPNGKVLRRALAPARALARSRARQR